MSILQAQINSQNTVVENFIFSLLIVAVLIILGVIIYFILKNKWKKKIGEIPEPTWLVKTDGRDRNDRIFKIFIGSPSGLEDERKAMCDEITEINEGYAKQLDIYFRHVAYGDFPSAYGRPQEYINKHLIRCDSYILILYDRWGSLPSNDDDWPFSSGSEEEFYIAEALLKEHLKSKKFRMCKIGVYFKKVNEDRWEKPDEQLDKVKQFKERLKEEKIVFFGKFEEITEFRKYIKNFLNEWLLETEKKRYVRTETTVLDVGLPGRNVTMEIEVEE